MVISFYSVFGKRMSVIREEQTWHLYNESDTGIRMRVYDVVIPSELSTNEIKDYLADIYHEYASAKYPNVEQVT